MKHKNTRKRTIRRNGLRIRGKSRGIGGISGDNAWNSIPRKTLVPASIVGQIKTSGESLSDSRFANSSKEGVKQTLLKLVPKSIKRTEDDRIKAEEPRSINSSNCNGNEDPGGESGRWNNPRTSGIVAAVLLLAMLVTAALSSARGVKASDEADEALNISADPSAQTATLKLAKEYIYAGSRMLAIEDYGINSAPTATPTPGASFNAVTDFSATSNPAGAWSYGQKATLTSALTAFTGHGQQWSGIDNWSMTSGGTCCGMVAKNNTGSTQSYVGEVTQPADLLNLHPGVNNEKTTVRWTAPSAGSYRIQGRFEGLDTVGTTTDVHVQQNNTDLSSGSINGFGNQATFDLTVAVAAGDAIDFAVGYGSNGNYNSDSTGLAVTISPSGGNTPTPTPTPGSGNSATYVQTDSTTQGNWIGVYGAQGYKLSQEASSLPTWAQVTLTGQSDATWASSTTDARALTKPGNTSDRIAGTWYTFNSYDISFNFTDGQSHKIALYCLDWDTDNTRSQKLEVLDGATNAVLDTRTLNAFKGGEYVVWQVSGNVKVRVTNLGPNAVVSGIFIDSIASQGTPTPTATPTPTPTPTPDAVTGCQWDYTALGGIISSNPTASVFNNQIFVFANGTDSVIYYKTSSDGTNFSAWNSLGGGAISDPGSKVVSGTLYVEVTGATNLQYVKSTTSGSSFSNWAQSSVSAPTNASVTFNNQTYTFAKGTGGSQPNLCMKVQ